MKHIISSVIKTIALLFPTRGRKVTKKQDWKFLHIALRELIQFVHKILISRALADKSVPFIFALESVTKNMM